MESHLNIASMNNTIVDQNGSVRSKKLPIGWERRRDRRQGEGGQAAKRLGSFYRGFVNINRGGVSLVHFVG